MTKRVLFDDRSAFEMGVHTPSKRTPKPKNQVDLFAMLTQALRRRIDSSAPNWRRPGAGTRLYPSKTGGGRPVYFAFTLRKDSEGWFYAWRSTNRLRPMYSSVGDISDIHCFRSKKAAKAFAWRRYAKQQALIGQPVAYPDPSKEKRKPRASKPDIALQPVATEEAAPQPATKARRFEE